MDMFSMDPALGGKGSQKLSDVSEEELKKIFLDTCKTFGKVLT